MKKVITIAAIACVTFASCVKNEPGNSVVGQSDSKIAFEAPILAPNVKSVAGYAAGELDTDATFTVWGLLTQNQIATTGLTADLVSANKYIDQKEVSYDNVESAWTAGNYYWPQNGYITFVGYLPATPSSGTFSLTEDGLQIENYTTAGAEDLLVSEVLYDRTKQNSVDGAEMVFKHALSALKFTVATELEDVTITLKSVALKGVYKTGSFDQSLSEPNFSMGSVSIVDGAIQGNKCWAASGELGDYSVATGLSQSITSAAYDVNTAAIDLIVIPQDLTQNAKIEVVYTLSGGSMTAEIEQRVSVPLLVANVPTQWLRGYCYTYNLNIHLDKITFSPEVEDWTDGDEHEIIEKPTFGA